MNIVLHTRIKFGSMVVTHNTTKPYKVAYIFLLLAGIQSVSLIYLTNVYYARNFNKIRDLWIENNIFKVVFISFELLKFTWIGIFVML